MVNVPGYGPEVSEFKIQSCCHAHFHANSLWKFMNSFSPSPLRYRLILTPTLLAITAFLSRSHELLNRGLGAQPLLGHGSHSSIFSPTDLNFLSPGLYNNLTPTYFLRASQFALNSTPRQSRSPLISWYLRPDAPVIYTSAFLLLTAWPGRRSICNNSITAVLLQEWLWY